MTVDAEIALRRRRFSELADAEGAVVGVPARALNESLNGLRVFYGGRGIWYDAARTKSLAAPGVAVGLLHTGRHYPDDLLGDGVIYHYPVTARPGKDAAEIEATKNAGRLGVPVFVVVQRGQLRDVHLGLIEDFDDSDQSFLIRFASADDTAVSETPQGWGSVSEEPFVAFDKKPRKRTELLTRERDPRFAFKVKKRSGSACAVCKLRVRGLIDAAHVIPVKEGGSDHPANGLPLCPTHHRAFDLGLFWIDAGTLAIIGRFDGTPRALGIAVEDISWLPAYPNVEALRWHETHIAQV